MKEIRISDVTAGELTRLIARQQEAILTVGRSRAFRLFFLPALKWQDEVCGQGNPHIPVNIRGIRDEATVAKIVMDGAVGVFSIGGSDAAYLVPAFKYWRKKVGDA